jgi:DHA1 family tetracycline resistance protein-like MFS transporter
MKEAGPKGGAKLFIFVTIVLDMCAVGMAIPVMPRLVQALSGGGAARAAELFGLLNMLWAAMQFLTSPLQGAISDRFGRRPVILMSNFGLGADYTLTALAPHLSWLFIGRILSGSAAGGIPAALAYLADTTPPEKRAASFGFLGAATGLGITAGMAFGGLAGSLNPRLPFWIAACLCLLNAVYGFFVLPESLPRERRTPFKWRHANPVGAFRLLRTHPALRGMAIVAFLVSLSSQALPNIVVLYVGYRYHWDIWAVSEMLTGWAICSMAAQGLLVSVAVHRLGERPTLMLGLVLSIAGFLAIALARSGPQFWWGVLLMAGGSISTPLINAFFSRRLGAAEQGRLQGATNSLNGVSGMVGPALFTQVFAMAVRGEARYGLVGAPFFLAAGLMTLAMGLAFKEVA